MSKIIYQTKNGKNLTQTGFVRALKQFINPGDAICVHSSVKSVGQPAFREGFMDIVIDAFKECVGPEGTIIMPTFTYNFCNGEDYDVINSPSTVGALGEYFRMLPDVTRTLDPNFSCAVWGKERAYFTEDINRYQCWGEGTIWERMKHKNTKIILMGVDYESFTFLHHIEAVAKVPYRYYKRFTGDIKVAGVIEAKDTYSDYYVRTLDGTGVNEHTRVRDHLIHEGLSKVYNVGDAEFEVLESTKVFKEIVAVLNYDPRFLVFREKQAEGLY